MDLRSTIHWIRTKPLYGHSERSEESLAEVFEKGQKRIKRITRTK